MGQEVSRAVANMTEAVEKMEMVACHVNEAIEEQARADTLFDVQEELRGLNGRTLMDFERRLVRRGDIIKISRGGPEKYHLILLSDILITTTASGKAYKVHQWIELSSPATSCSAITADAATNLATALQQSGKLDNAIDCSFAFHVHTAEKSFTVVPESLTEQQAWVTDLSDTISECQSGLGIDADLCVLQFTMSLTIPISDPICIQPLCCIGLFVCQERASSRGGGSVDTSHGKLPVMWGRIWPHQEQTASLSLVWTLRVCKLLSSHPSPKSCRWFRA